MKLLKRNDLILIIALILISALLWMFFRSGKQAGGNVSVIIDGQKKYSFDLRDNKREEIRQGDQINVLRIENGQVWIESANCANQLCVRHARIQSAGDTIVCLPHRLIVKIEGGETEVDSISH